MKDASKSVCLNEVVLWNEFRKGDADAYAVIYRNYFFLLFSYGKKICDDHDLVKDCIQDLFIKIWNNRENLAETNSIKYYLFTSLKRKLLDTLGTAQMRLTSSQDVFDEELVDHLQSTDEGSDEAAAWQKERVLKALNTLSEHQRKLLNMKFQKDLSNQEISEELGITIQSVYNAVFKALRSLRSQLSIALALFVSCF